MDQYSIENRIVELGDRGAVVSLTMSVYGEGTSTRLSIKIGSTYSNGIEIAVEGKGKEGAVKIEAAVDAAESFLRAMPARKVPTLPDFSPPPIALDRDAEHADSPAGRLAAEIEFDPTDARRARALATGMPQAGDRVRAGEDVGALS